MNFKTIRSVASAALTSVAITACTHAPAAAQAYVPPDATALTHAGLCVGLVPEFTRVLVYGIQGAEVLDYMPDTLLDPSLNDFQRSVLLRLSMNAEALEFTPEVIIYWGEISMTFCLDNVGTGSITPDGVRKFLRLL